MVATVEAMAIENDIKKVPKEILPTSFKFILIHFNVSLFNISYNGTKQTCLNRNTRLDKEGFLYLL